ncbi:MAG: fibronectin type III domain-containing protein [Patescibacteria group bacterium]
MNTIMKKIQTILLAFALLVVPTASFAAALNNDAQDFKTLRAVNITKNPGCVACRSTAITANPGDVLAFSIYYHNTGPDTANNVRVWLTPQISPSGTTHSFVAKVSADNASAVNGTTVVTLSGNQTIDFLQGSVIWWPNQSVTTSTAFPSGQTGAEIFTSEGLNLGSIASGWGTQGAVNMRFQVANTGTGGGTQLSVPVVATHVATNVLTGSATLNGYVDPKGTTDTVRWFEWGAATSLNNTTYQVSQGGSASDFSASISGLTQNSVYSYRAVARNAQGTVYGSVMTLTTTRVSEPVYAPLVSTRSASGVLYETATLNGFVDPKGSADTVRWFEWGSSSSLNNSTARVNHGSSASNFSANISGLTQNTTYYYRAVAQNAQGTVNGTTMSFTTEYFNIPDYPSEILVSTRSASNVSHTSATLNGYVDPSDSTDTVRWFEWGSSSSMNNTTYQVNQGSSASNFSANISGLTQNTTYYYRAVARNAQGTVYGSVLSFTTSYSGGGGYSIPLVYTRTATNITYDFAILNGHVDPKGTTDTMRWFEWGSSSYMNNTTSRTYQSNNASDFSASISGLAQNTTYYYRAVAQNSQGTVYGDMMSFSTNYTGGGNQTTFVPVVSTRNAEVSGDFAVLNGYVDPNGSNDTTRWFEWGGSQSLGSQTSRLAQGNVASNFSATLSSLVPNTTYYYRAMARNSQGTVYGSVLSFTTNSYGGGYTGAQIAPTVSTTLATEIAANSARLNSLVFSTGNYPSNAWFEWGTNTALGNKTQTVNVGSLPSVRHTDVITGLVPSVTYYYRAVAENPYGKSYGSIYSFVVNQTINTPPQTPTTVVITQPARPTPVRPQVVVVSPGAGTESLVELLLDGGADTISSNEERTYRISWKNTSKQTLKRVVLRAIIPAQMNFKSASTGSFSSEGNIVTVDAGTLTPGAIGEATFVATTERGLESGTLLVTTVNLVYTDAKGGQGDAVAYVTHRVEARDGGQGASPFGAGSFLPTTLFEWMILVILMLLLVLLGNHLYGRFSGPKH